MPTTSEGWIWFVGTTVFLGVVLSVIGNLLTNPIKKWLDRFSEQRQQKRLAENTAEYRELLETLKQIEEDKYLLIVMAHKAATVDWLSIIMISFVTCALTVGTFLTLGASLISVADRGFSFILLVVGIIVLVGGLWLMISLLKVRSDGRFYDLVVRAYERRDSIPPLEE